MSMRMKRILIILSFISISVLSFLGLKFIDFTALNSVVALILESFLFITLVVPLVELFIICTIYIDKYFRC